MSVWPKDNSAPDATCNSGKQSASPDPKSQNLGKGRKRAGVLRRWFSYELLMQRRGPLGSRGVGGEGVAGVLSWNRQGLVTNPADPCTVSPLLLAGRRAPTVTFCLKQKCLSGKLCAHCPQRSLPDTSSMVTRGGEDRMLGPGPTFITNTSGCRGRVPAKRQALV